jgi:hypothetical protein
MTSKMTRNRLAALAIATAVVLSGQTLLAQECTNCGTSHGWSNGDTASYAAMYPSPRHTPSQVGHTYITYPPFAPHHYLYTHHKFYTHREPCGGGRTITSVTWGNRWNPFRSWNEEAPFFNLNEALPR